MTHRRLLVALAALLALPACASFSSKSYQASRAALLSDSRTPFDRACRVSREPRALPPADQLLDSAAFTAAAASLWRQAGRPPGHVLLALRYEPGGVNVRRDVIEHRLPQVLADTLQRLAYTYRRTAVATDHEWGVRLRMDLGDAPTVRVGRTEVCAPRPREARNGGLMGGSGPTWGDVRDQSPYAASASSMLMDESTVWVRVALDARGYVTDARVERSLIRPLQETRLLSYVRTISFIPATEDGYPVPGQISLPMRLGRR
jgi:hypothetical protein